MLIFNFRYDTYSKATEKESISKGYHLTGSFGTCCCQSKEYVFIFLVHDYSAFVSRLASIMIYRNERFRIQMKDYILYSLFS